MNKRITALTLSLVLATSACTVFDSAAVNQQAAQNYRQVIGQAAGRRMLDTSSPTARRVQNIFRNMVPYADAANRTGQPFRWEMNVIRSDEINAWAMPGGKMAVYTGMVEKLGLTDDEIAAVIGHEMTHALLEHSKKEANRNVGIGIGAQLGASILTAATGANADLIGTGVGLATDLGLSKPFSRNAEREADMGGLQLMAQAGYDPRFAVSVWEKMNRANDNNDLVNKILSTHPTNNERISLIRRALPQMMPIYEQARAERGYRPAANPATRRPTKGRR